MKIVIIGAGGRLGAALMREYQGEHDVAGFNHAQLDLSNLDKIREKLGETDFDLLINAAAFTNVDLCETQSDQAFRVNAEAPGVLAEICGEKNAKLIHFSTDYVFGLDQKRRSPYAEDDPPGPVNVYGTSKLAGEYLLRSCCSKQFVIRTCGLYGVGDRGGKGGNFVETMLRLAQAGRPLRVVADQVCTPTYTSDLANAVVELIATKHYGLYHLTNANACSWYEFARAIFELERVQADLTAITSAEYAAPARRPVYSVLSTGLYESLGLAPLRPWPEALAVYLHERQQKVARIT